MAVFSCRFSHRRCGDSLECPATEQSREIFPYTPLIYEPSREIFPYTTPIYGYHREKHAASMSSDKKTETPQRESQLGNVAQLRLDD